MPEKTPDDPDLTIPQRLVRWFLALVVVCVLYAASFGPVTVISCRTGFPSMGTVWSFYTPLLFIAHKTSREHFLYASRNLWLDLCEPKGGYKFLPEEE